VSQHHDPVHPEPPHPELDVIADWQLGALDQTSADHVATHVAQCPPCQAAAAALTEVSTSLTGLPTLSAPPDVAARWDAALADLRSTAAEADPATEDTAEPAESSSATVVPLSSARSSNHWGGRALGVAASVAGLLLVAGVVYPLLHDNGSPGSPSAASTLTGGSSPTLPPTYSTGTEYRKTTLPVQINTALVAHSTGVEPMPTAEVTDLPSVTPTPTDVVGSSSMDPSSPTTGLLSAKDQEAVAKCVASLQLTTSPLFLDAATYMGRPAVVVVVPNVVDATKVDVFVMTRPCNDPNASLLYWLRTDRP
jgi:hypothetical protein